MAHTPSAYWRSYESTDPIVDLAGLLRFIEIVSSQTDHVVWRGVADAGWALHSKLYRYALATSTAPPTERALQITERLVVEKAREWGLDRVPTGLTGLELLAKLQHTGSPTRLIDVSHNPLVAAWFATGGLVGPTSPQGNTDGRLFAIDYSELELSDDGAIDPPWLDDSHEMSSSFAGEDVWVWTPPAVDRRMAAQSGAFMVGPVPTTQSGGKWYNAEDTTYATGGTTGRYSVAEVRRLTSIPVRAYKTMVPGERYRFNPLVSVRVAADAKAAIRHALEGTFNMSASMLFPDAFGLAEFLNA